MMEFFTEKILQSTSYFILWRMSSNLKMNKPSSLVFIVMSKFGIINYERDFRASVYSVFFVGVTPPNVGVRSW